MHIIRNILLVFLFVFGFVSCKTTKDIGEVMSVTNTATAKNCSITLFTDGITKYVSTSGDISNICDGNEDTSFYYYFYLNQSSNKISTYTITPNSSFVATFHVHIHLWRDNSYWDDKERLVIKVYKTDGTTVDLYDSGKVNDININQTFSVYSNVSKIEMTATHYGCSPKCHNYEIGIKTLTPSKMHGHDGTGIIQFLDDDEDGSPLKYKDSNGTTHSVFLVPEGHTAASKFHIKLNDKIYCFAKMP